MNDAVKLPLATVAATLAVALAVFTFRATTLPYREQQPNADTGSVTLAPEFRIGIVTDIHGKTGKQYDYRFMDPDKVMRPIIRFESYMEDIFHPDLIVQDGDLIEGSNRLGDKSITDFRFLVDELSDMGFPVAHVIGNHDRRGFHDDDVWKSLTGNDSTYSFRDQDDVRIIFLDYDDTDRSASLTDDENIYGRMSGAKYTISKEQVEWLRQTLESAEDRRIVVFTHVPVNESAILPGSLVNPPVIRQALRDLFATHGVKAVVSGHAEIFRFEEDRGVRYFALPGFHRSEAKNKPEKWYGTYAAMTVTDRADMIVRFEKEFGGPYQEVNVPSEAFDALPK